MMLLLFASLPRLLTTPVCPTPLLEALHMGLLIPPSLLPPPGAQDTTAFHIMLFPGLEPSPDPALMNF